MYSHSRLSCYEECPFKFKRRYIDKVRINRESIEAFVGTMVHGAMEKLYRDVNFGKVPPLEELLRWFREEWKKKWKDSILIVRKEYGQNEALALAERYITEYYGRHRPFDQSKTVGLEQRIEIGLDQSTMYKMEGYIDRLSYTPEGVYEIHDYKTTKTLPKKEQTLEDRQLALYCMAVKVQYPNAREIRLIWHYMHFNQDVTGSRTEHELERLRHETIEVIREIEGRQKSGDFPAKKSALCDWCEYRDQCPEWAHIAKTEKLPPNEFMDEPGVKLVDKYAELKAVQEEVEAGLSRVKEALVKFSERENVKVVAGTSHTARVWSRDTIKFPDSKDPRQAELERIIREMGKWDEASRLDVFKLEKIMKNGMWDMPLLLRLKPFARPDRIEIIYLNRKAGCE
jgi:putative RecB family exonuclease